MSPEQLKPLETLQPAIPHVSHAILRYGVAHQYAETHSVHAVMVFTNEHLKSERTADYGNVRLVERTFTTEDALAWLRSFALGEIRLTDDELHPTPAHLQVRRESGPQPTMTSWPEYVVQIDFKSNAEVRAFEPVVQIGLPPYRHAADACDRWIWTDDFPARPTRHRYPFTVIVPDRRARIAQASWTNGLVEIAAEGTELDDAEIQAVGMSTDGVVSPLKSCPATEPVRWSPAADIASLEVFLVHPEHGLLTRAHIARSDADGAPLRSRSLSEQTERDLAHGENERVEYKPFIRIKDPKEAEITKTIVGFANAGGGRLYIGVDDDGVPEGWDALRKAAQADTTDGLQKLADRVSTLNREKVKPVPVIHVQMTTHRDDPLLVVEVNPSDDNDVPYATHDNEIFIRKGASCRRPDPAELRGLFERGPSRRKHSSR